MKRTALLQRFKLASRSAAEWLQKGWLQQLQILAAWSSALKLFGSDKQRFSNSGNNSQTLLANAVKPLQMGLKNLKNVA